MNLNPLTLIKALGRYMIFLGKTVSQTERFSVYPGLIMDEMVNIGSKSVFIVSVVSVFIGAVTAVQTAHNLFSPFVPKLVVGTIVRDMVLLELSTTFTCVILAGKVGSNIAGNLGTMRITEQIDALDVMGINSASYLALPKIIAGTTMVPLLTILSCFLGIIGGYLGAVASGLITNAEYVEGIRTSFVPYNILFALVKATVFGFLITSISAFEGFYTKGGSLEVGVASTNAVTNSCIALLVADYVIAGIML
jgi:phospholipid/cholesterol/gamma-HCH transport system permease protein